MPQMGESIAEGTITKWLVKEGDYVERDQALFEISTDKVDAEIPSPGFGFIQILETVNTTVPVNNVVAVLYAQKTDIPAKLSPENPVKTPEAGVELANHNPATNVVMPQMGESIAEGTITKWLVEEGAYVERDQALFEISTDKVDAEIPSPGSGFIQILVPMNSTVPVNHVVAMIHAHKTDFPPKSLPVELAPNIEIERPQEPALEPVAAMDSPRLKVFLCHCSDDKPQVRDLYRRLSQEGFDPWLDEEDLLPGQNWRLEIPRVLRESHVAIVCLSQHSMTKAGYVQKEMRVALDILQEQPEGSIYLIPLKLEACQIPDSLSDLHCEILDERGFQKLLRSLRARASQLRLIV